ncbi:serine/threonine-protein kinase RIO2 [Halococcoides cellulosivorans]|uniref:non-specific serine/threonine protein kinase n=1 Tax=Halococcoides cellulosivorans TaxID=1679096 RepID=A0A2R4WZA9_9EURY|nr:RIO1 family regulatory kinase/ATPase [Halococcoides cellulosivorans]AWB26845.1 serine/threonine protein phosphatase [Halococcoides cellulosivorans]
MVENVAGVIADLEPEDIHLLSGVEQGMRFSEWVQRSDLPKYSGLNHDDLQYRIDRCADRELIERKTIQYEGYTLTFEGYDALALHTFAERGTIDGVGAPLGVGKESDVYEVQSYRPMALKYHREGYTEFRAVDREREYTADRDHVSWLYTARQAAEREFETLEALYPDVAVPRPIDQNRHAIVMERIDGVELRQAALDPSDVPAVVRAVFEVYADAVADGFIHADLSEYNVFVTESGVVIFDWPQAVATDHDNSAELLERDVENLLSYVARKYPNAAVATDDPARIADAVREGRTAVADALTNARD